MRGVLTILLLTVATLAAAQTAEPENAIPIREVPIWGRRPMKRIGIQQSDIDSAALKQNIALSVADVLSYNSNLFVKQYGRATLATVSFRGTGPSHTQVTWNGMRLSNPMLGMADFSMIPSYFIDNAAIAHGTSALGQTGGALGGAVMLSTRPAANDGFDLQYVQGVGMYHTFDEFLRLGWGNSRWQLSTRAVHQSSRNDYPYRNRDKRENIYDDDHNIIATYHPRERNRSGAFADLHLLQEAYHTTRGGDRLGLTAWYTSSRRELPLLTTDYADDTDFENRQREQTFRGILSWDHLRSRWKIAAKAGYIHTWMAYDYRRDPGNGTMQVLTRSRSLINTLYGHAEGEYAPSEKWFFNGSVTLHQHFVESSDKNVITVDGDRAVVGYEKSRVELSAMASAKWKPTPRLGLAAVMRAEMYGTEWAPLPALFADFLISERGNVVAKASVSRNERFPTLNDLYFLPGGNPDLASEKGFQYEAGISFAVAREGRFSVSGSASWYDQHTKGWIMWLPTTKGFFSPVNVKDVHSYGVELRADAAVALAREVRAEMSATFTWSPSINEGGKMGPADQSAGKQLPYEPRYSSNISARLAWRTWSLHYSWCWYSERYTMSSNNLDLSGRLTPYFMSNLAVEKRFSWPRCDLSLKGAVNNLLNEEYISVLSRPMPRMNVEFFIGIRPKWRTDN